MEDDRRGTGGEGFVRRADEDDTEGHGITRRVDDDTEGHGITRRVDDDDTEGHGITRRLDDEDDTEGHKSLVR